MEKFPLEPVEARYVADNIEYLSLPFEVSIDTRASDFENLVIEGYASKFGNINSYREYVDPGAFEETILERGPRQGDGLAGPQNRSKIKYLWQHDTDEPMGIPLVLREDSVGLLHRTRITRNRTNEERMELVKDGVVDAFSIGFKTLDFLYDDDGHQHKTKIKLYEYSSVTFPADEHALIAYAFAQGQARLGDDFGSEEFVAKLGTDILMHFARRVSDEPQLVQLAIDFLNSARQSAESNGPPQLRSGVVDEAVEGEVDPELVRQMQGLGEDIGLYKLGRKAKERIGR